MVSNKPERRHSRIGNAARLRQGYGRPLDSARDAEFAQAIPACPERSRRVRPQFGPKVFTSHSSLITNHCLSNRYTARVEIAVTCSKQRTVVLSNRYKKSSPRGVATWLPPVVALDHSNRNNPETGIAVTHSKQTTAVLSNRNKKTPPGGCLNANQKRTPGETSHPTRMALPTRCTARDLHLGFPDAARVSVTLACTERAECVPSEAPHRMVQGEVKGKQGAARDLLSGYLAPSPQRVSQIGARQRASQRLLAGPDRLRRIPRPRPRPST